MASGVTVKLLCAPQVLLGKLPEETRLLGLSVFHPHCSFGGCISAPGGCSAQFYKHSFPLKFCFVLQSL
jgi:hypothetical protein